MNSLRSALTAVLAGPAQPRMQAKGDFESRLCTSDMLTIELVQTSGSSVGTSPGRPPLFAVLEPVTFAVHLQNVWT
jgi:hypothetical protein